MLVVNACMAHTKAAVSHSKYVSGTRRLQAIKYCGGQKGKKSLISLKGKSMSPSGKYFSLPFLPATPSSPSRTLEGLFELTPRRSRALDSPRALLPELQRYKDTVRCATLGAEVTGHRQEQLTQTLIVHLSKTHFLH